MEFRLLYISSINYVPHFHFISFFVFYQLHSSGESLSKTFYHDFLIKNVETQIINLIFFIFSDYNEKDNTLSRKPSPFVIILILCDL